MGTTTAEPGATAGSDRTQPVHGRSGRLSRRATVIVWCLAALLLGLGSWTPAWSGDEAATVMVVRRPFLGVVRTAEVDPALGPYYLLMDVWAVVSTSPLWLRLLSVLAMATAVAAVSDLATRFAGLRCGMLAAGLMLTLPAVSRWGQDARPYALSVAVVAAAVLVWDGDLGRSRRWVALAGLVAASGLVQPYALLIVPVLLATSLLTPREDRRLELVRTASASGAGVVLVSPYLLLVTLGARGQPAPPSITVPHLVEEAVRWPAGVLTPPLAGPLGLAVILLVFGGIVIGWRRGGDHRRLAMLAGSWALLPPLLLCAVQVADAGPGLVARYWTFCLPALALGGAVTLDAIWLRSRAAAVTVLVGLVALGLPTQLTIRTADGHLGQRWRALPAVLALPALREAPLLVEGWSYRGLVSNDPSLAGRMPLVVDPDIDGRVNPVTHGPGSSAYVALVEEHDLVVVLQGERGFSAALPSARSFSGFRRELRAFPVLAVRCAYFGEPLGVFTTTDGRLPAAAAEELARQLSSVAPDRVRCAGKKG